LTDPYADFGRVAEVAGQTPLHPRLIRRTSEERRFTLCAEELANSWGHAPDHTTLPGGLELELLPAAWSSHFNSAYPRDRNNGVLWAGRGLSTELRGGIALRWGPLSAALAPALLYQQNRSFEIATGTAHPDFSPYIYQGHPQRIDWPQRFGDSSFGGVDLGQSYLRVDAYHFALGISNENLWWGPALRNPLLMSNTAPGFPHLFLGTSGPVDLWIGRFEGQAIWGRLSESDYFDNDPDNDRRLLAGLVVNFEPRWIRGLFLGAARSYLREIPVGGLPRSTWLIGPYQEVRDNPLGRGHSEADNQLFSVFARWVPPRAGFEAYIEYARDDHWADLEELIAVPDASRAFTMGFQKVLPRRDESWLRIAAEVTQIADPLPTIRRPLFVVYTHGQLRQGYTHNGRLLGAAIGPNANSQFLGVDLFTATGRRGAFVERVRYNVDANGERWVRAYGAEGADIEWNAGVHRHHLLRRLDLGWALTHSYRRNRHYFGLYGDAPEFRAERSWNIRFDLGWRPGGLMPRETTPSAPPVTGES
jgi:hypothetical protein